MTVTGALFLFLLAQNQDYLADGIKALDANQPAAAEPLLRKAIEAEPTDYSAHFNLAFALSLQNKDPEAIAEYRKTLELKPALYEADLNLGILLLRNKKPADALPLLKEAAEAKPNAARPGLYYAQALLESGDAAAAEHAYTASLEADPKSTQAQIGLGRALLEQAKFPEAAGHFRAAGYKPGLLAVAQALETAGRINEAIPIYKEFPESAEVREHLGRLQVDSKDPAAAIPNLEEAVRKSPTAANRLALADAYKLNKQPARMMEQLQLAAASEPGNYDLRMAYGRALRDDRLLAGAAQQFQAAAKIRPDSAPAWNELANALIVNGNLVEGLAALDQVHALGKEVPGDYFLRAITLDKLTRKEKPLALAAYKQFLEADNGAHPDQDFQARARIRIIENELNKR